LCQYIYTYNPSTIYSNITIGFYPIAMGFKDEPRFSGVQPEIIIAGGGIGGLAVALQLHAVGFTNITVFEAAKEIAMLGVGLNLQPSAVLVLRNLGLLEALGETGIETSELNYYNRHGNPILSEKRGKSAGYLIPQFSVHRGELHALLLNAFKDRLGAHRFHLDHAIASYTPATSTTRTTAHFVSRSNPAVLPKYSCREADILVAADGINSTIRAQLYPNEGPPKFSGRMLWRGAMLRAPYLTGKSMVWAGHADQKFIAYPISRKAAQEGESLVNWIAELRVRDPDDPDTTPPKPDWTKAVPKEKFAGQFKSWGFKFLDIPELIESAKDVYEFPMCDRDPVDRWSFGRLTLIGDAAHPMYPIGSNGASQAILDARELATQLCKTPFDIEGALKGYESVRLPATAAIVHANRGQGPDYVMELAEKRSPEGFKNVHDIISAEEIEEVGAHYKAMCGFDIETVNRKAVETDGSAERFKLKSEL
jgi:2-polyprenyl-6-methoxyphenol hydroxylase-like FAD-dependent oxidoreductase